MATLRITQDTRPRHLEAFCGETLLQYTGVTKVKTTEGEIILEIGDIIVKKDDGTFDVKKSKQQKP